MMKTLVLITDVFPYGSITETSFIAPEIPSLARVFDRVIIAPRMKISDIPDIADLPMNVEMSDALIIRKTLSNKLMGLPRIGRAVIHDLRHTEGSLRDILAYSSYVEICRRDLTRFIRNEHLDLSPTLFYTFWFDFTTAALSLIPGTRFLTRVHGHDLYDNRHFISDFWRKKTLDKIIACHSVSHAGVDYLKRRFPAYADKFGLRLLGTSNSNGLNPMPADCGSDTRRKLVLLGIARISPEKGVLRQAETIIRFARSNPQTQIEYIHIGDGPEMNSLVQIFTNPPANLTADIRGALHNSEVHKLLATTHIDAVLLLSHSEGLPVSICEAISYGIPYLATDVGGIHEILPEGTLPLLPKDFSYEEFEKALNKILTDKNLRSVVRKFWEQRFDAGRIRAEFADELAGMLPKGPGTQN